MWVEAVLTFSITLSFPLNFTARLHGVRVWFEKKELKTRLIYPFPSLDRWISKSLPLHPRPKNENEQSSMENHQASPISQALIIVDISLLTIGSLAGAFGNRHACVLCWKRKDLYKVPQVLFVNLSLYCFLTSLTSLDDWVFVAVTGTVLRFTRMHVLFSFIIVPVVYVCIILNILTLSLREISRQDCVTRPLDQRMTRHSVKKITLVCWILVTVLASAAVTFDILGEHPYCHNFDQYDLLNKMRSNNSFISSVLQACLYRWTWRLFL